MNKHIFLSADIEGTAGIVNWNETTLSHPEHAAFAAQMTREVRAACDGAIAAGAEDILIKDAHDSARNIDPQKLPEQARIVRGWAGSPWCMMTGIETGRFDAAVMTGYHSWAGSDNNPLAHTMNTGLTGILLNGELIPEFLINAYTAAYVGVPTVFLSGDEGLCEYARQVIPAITTVATGRGIGGAGISIQPELAVRRIREGVEEALKGDLSACLPKLPEYFETEVVYKDFARAYRMSFYPGASRSGNYGVRFESGDFWEVLRFWHFTT